MTTVSVDEEIRDELFNKKRHSKDTYNNVVRRLLERDRERARADNQAHQD